MTPESLRGDLAVLLLKLEHGCGNGGCRIKKPIGQATNMVCQCTPNRFAKALLNIAADAEKQGYEWERKPKS